ncbi:hypothetical protein HJFPF1_10110 [Paramyrothecium foliicola]|nr:hypothetical protein HJFPF1_10110 [Paramyrothecium foliicola]
MSLRRSARVLTRASNAAIALATPSAPAPSLAPAPAPVDASPKVRPVKAGTASAAKAPSRKSSASSKELETILFHDAEAFEAWLAAHGRTSPGIWLKIAKKASGIPSVDYAQALDIALCYGWIDGQRRSLDADHFLQRFTPRRPGSLWSRRNVGKVDELVAKGRMRPEGQAEVDAARADGRWERAYAAASTIQVPEDFEAALAENPRAERFFATLNKGQRYPFLLRIETAKKPETRRNRIEQFVTTLAEGKTL